MTAIRLSLLTDHKDKADDIKQCFLAGLLCFLLSVLAHLMFFSVWQFVDNDPAGKFNLSLAGESVPIELVLTYGGDKNENETLEPGQPALNAPPRASLGGLFSPEESFAGSYWNYDFLQTLKNLNPGEKVFVKDGLREDYAGMQNPVPIALAAQTLAQSKLLPATDGDVEDDINIDPPISLEHLAPLYKSYKTAVRSAIGKLWILPPAAKTQFRPGRLTILVTISRDGELLRWVVQKSSGNATLDHAGQEALRSAAPFPPFPSELSQLEQLDLTMHFDYKVVYKRAGSGFSGG